METFLSKSAVEAQADFEDGGGTIKSLVDVDAVKAILALDSLVNAITATSIHVFGIPK
jgi:hypothetical protein